MTPYRIVVCASRGYADRYDAFDAMSQVARRQGTVGPVVIVHGDAGGPFGRGGGLTSDRLLAAMARRCGLAVEAHPADWDRYGRRAGPIRNQEMLDSGVDEVIAFWDGFSRGTKHMIDIATAARVDVRVVRFEVGVNA